MAEYLESWIEGEGERLQRQVDDVGILLSVENKPDDASRLTKRTKLWKARQHSCLIDPYIKRDCSPMRNFYTFGKRTLSTRSSFFDRARSDFEKREAMLTRILARMKGASEVGLLGWYPQK